MGRTTPTAGARHWRSATTSPKARSPRRGRSGRSRRQLRARHPPVHHHVRAANAHRLVQRVRRCRPRRRGDRRAVRRRARSRASTPRLPTRGSLRSSCTSGPGSRRWSTAVEQVDRGRSRVDDARPVGQNPTHGSVTGVSIVVVVVVVVVRRCRRRRRCRRLAVVVVVVDDGGVGWLGRRRGRRGSCCSSCSCTRRA